MGHRSFLKTASIPPSPKIDSVVGGKEENDEEEYDILNEYDEELEEYDEEYNEEGYNEQCM